MQLAAWYVPSDSSRRAVVLVHGKDGSRTADFNGGFMDLAAALHKRGLAVLMIDLRGHGQSDDAHFSFGINERRDIEGAVDWLMARQFPPGSMGPKIDAAIRFLEMGGKRCIIAHLNEALPALRGETGTHIVADHG